jgi:hypothetical protein
MQELNMNEVSAVSGAEWKQVSGFALRFIWRQDHI